MRKPAGFVIYGLVLRTWLTEIELMALLNIRNLISIAAGVSASAVAVRNALGKEVDKRADKMIQKAVDEAREEIRHQAHTFVSDGFRNFLLTVCIKAVLVLIVAVLFLSGLLPSNWSALVLLALFVIFTSYDFTRAFPTLRFLRREVKKFGWRPKLVLAETVSAQVFEKVLERASGQPVDSTESVLMLLAGRKRDEMVEKVARAVAEIASTSSWDDIKPIVLRFAARFALMFVLYSGLVWSVVWLIRHHFVTT